MVDVHNLKFTVDKDIVFFNSVSSILWIKSYIRSIMPTMSYQSTPENGKYSILNFFFFPTFGRYE